MAWVYLILAGLFEVGGVIGMNKVAQRKNLSSFAILFGAFACSFTFLALAMKTLPMGVSYAVWTGIGTVGGTLVGMFIYNESKDWKRVLFISFIIIAVVGLKITQ
ncbi:multidrug efflux SMR transporter [Solibacillus sp. MA9]|uniref:Multidrug efflux SMR transporter n=1 Tax=Solibacillus palustris TaxID=2908203 RepID=A0ABS9UCT3_9BACL|nr:multidrug efflux SMR transporter [Solibacillus sp. MA9]MCH7322048.1 multidrug efflux SMR transporter [Solibacillus sp. MA9]